MKFPVSSTGVVLLSALLFGFSSVQDQVRAPKFRTLGAIEFTGNKFFDQDTLRKQLRLVRIGGSYDSNKLQADIESNLKGFLKENGFLQCETTWQEQSLSDGSVGIKINVVEGTQFHLGKLEIKGAKEFPVDELTPQFHLRPGDVLNFAEVKSALVRIQQMYWDKGYVDFSYIPDQQFNQASQTADLIFTFDEGPRYRVAYIGIVGCGEQSEEDRVRAQIGLRPGDFFSQSALQASVAAINKLGLYQELGENDYAVVPLDEKPGVLSVVFYLKPRSPQN